MGDAVEAGVEVSQRSTRAQPIRQGAQLVVRYVQHAEGNAVA